MPSLACDMDFPLLVLLICVLSCIFNHYVAYGRLSNGIDKRGHVNEENSEELKRLIGKLEKDVKSLEETVKTQNMMLKRQEYKLDSVDDVSYQTLDLLRDMTGAGPGDCAELYLAGVRESGVHTIFPRHSPPVKAFCDMNHDGGGWTMFQRRFDGQLSFNKNWVQYARGFGKPSGEHWLGLRNIHKLTSAHEMELFVALTDFKLGLRYEKYGSFSVGSEDDKFRLTVGQPSGNAGDSLTAHSGMPFSTKDRDNDHHNSSCSKLLGGSGWWFHSCHISNLNGVYYRQLTAAFDAMSWYGMRNSHTSLKASVMMMRPADFEQKKEV